MVGSCTDRRCGISQRVMLFVPFVYFSNRLSTASQPMSSNICELFTHSFYLCNPWHQSPLTFSVWDTDRAHRYGHILRRNRNDGFVRNSNIQQFDSILEFTIN